MTGTKRKGDPMPKSPVRETNMPAARLRPLPWMPIFDIAGVPVGHVGEPAESGDYLLVEKGFFFTKLVYVPIAAIMHADALGVHLCLSKDELNGAEYATPIAAAAIAG